MERSREPTQSDLRPPNLITSRWTWACIGIASAKALVGIAGFAWGYTRGISSSTSPFPPGVFFALVLAYATAAGLLIFAGRRDSRAVNLGVVFLATAATFADFLIHRLFTLAPAIPDVAIASVLALQPSAFIAYFLWLFVRDFPRGEMPVPARGIFRVALRLSLVAGTVLFLASFLWETGLFTGSSTRFAFLASLLDRRSENNYYWLVLFALILPALLFAVWKARRGRVEERRRVGLFIAGIIIGSAPLLSITLLEVLIPAFRERMYVRSTMLLSGILVFPFLLSIPFTTTYSVLVHHVLDIRVIVRKAIQYALARYTILAVAGLPIMVLLAYLYGHRDETITKLLSGWRPLELVAGTGLGLIAYRFRRVVFDAIDRRFFREHYEAHHILAALVDSCREARSSQDLASRLSAEIDCALHVETLAILLLDESNRQFKPSSGRVRPLSLTTRLPGLIETGAQPLDVDLEDVNSPLRRLPLEDQQWLADGAFRLIVPIISSNGTAVGLLALGEKKSELPFSREDRLLLRAIGASAALVLENRLARTSSQGTAISPPPGLRTSMAGESGSAAEECAAKCRICFSIQPLQGERCSLCGGQLEPISLPYLLLGKFRLEKEVGAGGMGVVYRALDLALQRAVALKTLPTVSPDRSVSLRREARAMAAVMHPNLALIFGAETWRGIPILIFEFLEGGTLADRLMRERIELAEVIRLGITLAGVLDKIHSNGILHRDIKPSNIGYTIDYTPKLLDFGLARIMGDAPGEQRLRRAGIKASSSSTTVTVPMPGRDSLISRDGIAGTLRYLSPEAVNHKPPHVSFDIWSLSIVLFEAIAGRHPLAGTTASEALRMISLAKIPDIREFLPACQESLALFFRAALARDPARRPAHAVDLRAKLTELLRG